DLGGLFFGRFFLARGFLGLCRFRLYGLLWLDRFGIFALAGGACSSRSCCRGGPGRARSRGLTGHHAGFVVFLEPVVDPVGDPVEEFWAFFGVGFFGEVVAEFGVVLGVVLIGLRGALAGFAKQFGPEVFGEKRFDVDVFVGQQCQEVFDVRVAGGHEVGAVVGEPEVEDLDRTGAFSGGQLAGGLGCLGGVFAGGIQNENLVVEYLV